MLVEGVLDLHHLRARGHHAVAALGGTGATPALFEQLTRQGIETITLALDADTPGHAATIAAIDAAYRAANAPDINIVRIRGAADPDAPIGVSKPRRPLWPPRHAG